MGVDPARLQGVLGLAAFCGIAWLLSQDRSRVRWRAPLIGIALQFLLAALLLYLPGMRKFFAGINLIIDALQQATDAGSTFVFGFLGGGLPPFSVDHPEHSFILAFRALPIVLVLSALTSVLVYWRVLPAVVNVFARLLERSLKIGGAVGFGAAATVFLGMIEAPLLIRPYLRRLTASELFILMTTGMATIAGTVLVLYASLLADVIPDAGGHLLIASLISVPAAVTFALIMVPENDQPTNGTWIPPRGATSAIDALAKGTQAGLGLVVQIAAMLLVLVALVHLINSGLAALLPDFRGAPISLERMAGYVMAPLAWLMGIPWHEATAAGRLLGIKTVLNELIAYVELSRTGVTSFSPRSRLILTYALCGFANFGSLGIMIGGLGQMLPARRELVIRLGPRAIIAGTLATLSTGAVIGLLVV